MRAFLSEFRAQALPMQFSCAAAIAVAIFIGFMSFQLDYPLSPLLAVSAALVGWIIGILASPMSKEQEDHFGELAKVAAGFFSGYLVSKIDPLVGALVTIPQHGQAEIMQPLVAERVLITLSSFFATLVTVFAVRLYWDWDAVKKTP
jgi:hypothetical protein